MDQEIKSKSYTLYTENGGWLGQIVLTSDGMFASVTDYGNLSYAWRSFGGGDFRKFLLDLNVDYFSGKMYSGLVYIAYGKKYEASCELFGRKILPALQNVLKTELESNINW